MVLSCNNISISFGEKTIIDNGSFNINDNETTAVVGLNGAGKTTLLRAIVGEQALDSGNINFAKGITFGYLKQQVGYNSDNTIYEELLSVKKDVIEIYNEIRELEKQMSNCEGEQLEKILDKYNRLQTTFENGDGYSYKSKVLGVVHGLGFNDDTMHTIINKLSGGQKTRVFLGKLLLMEPDLLLLDEPTNHLDIDSIEWLENYLLSYKKSVLIVSHDRFFLDKISDNIIEIENKKLSFFKGTYSDYSVKKSELRKALIKQYINQQQEIKHQEAVIDKLKQFNREKSIKRAESREKMLNKIDKLDKPIEYNKKISLTLTPNVVSGNDVISISDFKKSFGTNHLFENINFEIKRGEKVAIIGNNGTGKTTLLKMINGLETIDAGSVLLGTNVTIGYYDQEHNVLDDKNTIFDEIKDEYPYLTDTKIRNVLASFLFTKDDVFKKISQLSGGEKGRVSLAKLMLSNANFLLLDEPTNHLDIMSKEILEDAIKSYEGTVLYVSHDRYFINKTATRVMELTHNMLLNYDGNFNYYLEKKEIVEKIHITDTIINKQKNDSTGKLDWKKQKEIAANKRKIENKLKDIEAQIAKNEEKIEKLDSELNNPAYATNAKKLMDLSQEKSACEADISSLMEEWENFATKLEQFDN